MDKGTRQGMPNKMIILYQKATYHNEDMMKCTLLETPLPMDDVTEIARGNAHWMFLWVHLGQFLTIQGRIKPFQWPYAMTYPIWWQLLTYSRYQTMKFWYPQGQFSTECACSIVMTVSSTHTKTGQFWSKNRGEEGVHSISIIQC